MSFLRYVLILFTFTFRPSSIVVTIHTHLLMFILQIQANAYVPNWGQIIFQSAKEIASNNVFRQRVQEYQSKVGEEREWWDRKKASIQEDFMKELDREEQSKKATSGSKLAPSGPTNQTSNGPPSVTGSDDDAVLVEAEAPASTPSGGKKKKKGKK